MTELALLAMVLTKGVPQASTTLPAPKAALTAFDWQIKRLRQASVSRQTPQTKAILKLQRLATFALARPQSMYIMADINDLKQGVTDNDILWNLRQIVRCLQQTHPHARIVVPSILPTRTAAIPSNRIGWLNHWLETIAHEDGAVFLDL